LRYVECRSGCIEILGDELGAGDSMVIGSRIGSMDMSSVMSSIGICSVMGSLGKVGEADFQFGSVVGNVQL